MHTFETEETYGISDHCLLLCVLGRPRVATPQARHRVCPPAVKWDPARREQYRQFLLSPEYSARRANLTETFHSGRLPLSDTSRAWSEVVLDAAGEVFGSGRPHRRQWGGRSSKQWFYACIAKHQALRDAVRRGDTHAARRVFNAKKLRVQRHLAQEDQSDFCMISGTILGAFELGINGVLCHRRSVTTWGHLQSTGRLCMQLRVVGACVSAPPRWRHCYNNLWLRANLNAAAQAPLTQDGSPLWASLDSDITGGELEAAVRKLKYGRAVGA